MTRRPAGAATATATPAITAAAPIIPVRDLDASLRFYTGSLGFDEAFVSADRCTAEVVRDGARLMLIACEDADTLAAAARTLAIYLRTESIDALWAELAPGLEALPGNRVRAPFTQPYGTREFHVKDPDGALMLFGEDAGAG